MGSFPVKYHRNYAITLFTVNSRLLQVISIFRFRNNIPQFTRLHLATTVIEKVFRSSLNALYVFMCLFFLSPSFSVMLLFWRWFTVQLIYRHIEIQMKLRQPSMQTDVYLKLFVRYLNKARSSVLLTATDANVFLVCRCFRFRTHCVMYELNHQVVTSTFSFDR